MQFTENADRLDVRYVASLARIALSDAEADALQPQLDGILRFVGELKAVDTSSVAPSVSTAEAAPLRDDIPCDGLDRDAALALAPRERLGHFAVPRILE